MKNLFKISIILLFCIILSSCFARENDLKPRADDPNYPTIWDMAKYANDDIKKNEKKINEIYDKLAKNFHNDEDFVRALRENQKAFFQYQKTENNYVLPKGEGNSYGLNYSLYSSGIYETSTNKQILNLRELSEKYCLYNSFLDNEKACKPETLDKIFK